MGRMLRRKKNKNDKAKSIPISQIELAAFHEAGHAVIDLILGIPFFSVSISVEEMENGTKVGGMVESNGKRPNSDVIMSLFAGQISEDIKRGKNIRLTDSATSTGDNQWALRAALDYCLSDYEALKFMEWCHARAANLLKLNWAKVEHLASELMARRFISYEEAKAVFSEPETTPPEAQGSNISSG